MKANKLFLSALSTVTLMVITQAPAAHMLFTYESSVMDFYNEDSYSQDGTPLDLNLHFHSKFQYSATFIIPDVVFDLEEAETQTVVFDNPVVSFSSSGVFPSTSVARSSFLIEANNHEGLIIKRWELMLDIVDNNLPNVKSLTASIRSTSEQDVMTLDLDDLHYTRQPYSQIVDVSTRFYGEFWEPHPHEYPGGLSRLVGMPVSVPEPLSPVLLLSGLVGIFAVRKMKVKPA